MTVELSTIQMGTTTLADSLYLEAVLVAFGGEAVLGEGNCIELVDDEEDISTISICCSSCFSGEFADDILMAIIFVCQNETSKIYWT